MRLRCFSRNVHNQPEFVDGHEEVVCRIAKVSLSPNFPRFLYVGSRWNELTAYLLDATGFLQPYWNGNEEELEALFRSRIEECVISIQPIFDTVLTGGSSGLLFADMVLSNGRTHNEHLFVVFNDREYADLVEWFVSATAADISMDESIFNMHKTRAERFLTSNEK